ncbi:SpoIIE family protein phosphatase [Streptomyces fragilis]|uniref:SpoIIE family protein phosphatase n=1 Tax=Streptomyces fragilis TaxID=67301 RepID=A0ABV2YRR2_9ACTN|nr:SpoIIE family protein phosphatase [Streptomyces fragilis]
MTIDPARSAETGAIPDVVAPEAVLERAKGVIMALTGSTADAAHAELLRRARGAGRTLLDECWITLSGASSGGVELAGDAASRRTVAVPAPASPSGRGSSPAAWGSAPAPAEDANASVLRRVGRALVRVDGPAELAAGLREHLAESVGPDAVVVFSARPDGGLELTGDAGLDEDLAALWRGSPPAPGSPVAEVFETREPHWLETADGGPGASEAPWAAGPWGSGAWLPVGTGTRPAAVLGVLRRGHEPLPPRTRELLRSVARLCSGRLGAFDTRPQPFAEISLPTVQAVLAALPEAALALVPLRSASGQVEDYRIEAASPAVVGLTGLTGEALTGVRLLESFPALADEHIWQGLLNTLATGEPYEGEPMAYPSANSDAGELPTFSVRARRLGDGLMLTWSRYEIAERQEQRLSDVQRLGNLGWTNWNLLTEEVNWSPQVFRIFDRSPADGAVPYHDLPDQVLAEDRPALTRAVRSLASDGRAFDVPFRIRTAHGVRHLRAVAEAVTDTHGTPVEAHGFVQDLTAQRSAELALVESERMMLTQHGMLRAERSLASRLQQALLPLPHEPVRPGGLRVDVAYLPAQSGIQVGGDWFSAIELPDGDALCVVGDVAGHGIDAVATMAQLRFTAKGMVITGSSLTGALTRLNALLLHTGEPRATATMVLARYNPGERKLVWAQAGHPPPLLLRDGEARFLKRPVGMLLGAVENPPFQEAETVLEPGDRILLYTDGLIERPSEGIDAGLQRLAAAAAGHDEQPGSASLGPLLAEMLEGERRDDVCVLDIRVMPEKDLEH